MQPDLKRERRAGWGALAGALVLCGAALGWYSSDDTLSQQLDSKKSEHDRRTGPEPMAEHVAKQEKANQALVSNIDELKKGVGFTVSPFFTLKQEDLNRGTQPGTVFNNRFASVYDEISEIARNKGIHCPDPDFGFSAEKDTPPGAAVPLLLTMLQLTRKATLIAFATPTPLGEFTIKHDAKPRVTGPKDRPLQREYGLTMQVKGSLRDVMWILFHLSLADAKPGDAKDPGGYPLVLQNLEIDSPNTAEVDPSKVIQQVTATFRIAGIEFLPEDQRATAGRAPGVSAPATRRPGLAPRGGGVPSGPSAGARP